MTVPDSSTGGGEATGRIGVVLRDPLPWADALQVVRTAEETGYEAVFVPEIDGRDAFATLAGFASATGTIGLGTGVVTVRSRSPVATAMAAATIGDLSGGRMILGLGSGSPGAPAPASAASLGPLSLTEEFVRVVRDILAGREASSEAFGLAGFRLALESRHEPPPVWLAALGDRMVALAGRVADGVLLNWCPPERVASARETLTEAARAAGRDPADITVAVYARACLGVEEEVAEAALREMTGRYATIPHYLAQLEAVGLGGPARVAARAFADGRPHEVPDDLVLALAVVGGREEALARFDAYHAAGADLVLVYPVSALEPFSSVLGTVLTAAPSPAMGR